MRSIYLDKNIPRVLLTKALTPIWPGFVWTPFSAVTAGEIADQPLPGPRWMRVKNGACGICATDLSLLFVKADPSVAPAALPGISRIYLGHEAVGTVSEVGSGVTRFRPGDRVIMDQHFYGANCFNLELDPPCEMCARGDFIFCLRKSDHPFRGIGGGFGDSFITHETGVYPCPAGLTLDQAVLVEPLAVGIHAVARHSPKAGQKVLVIGAGMIGLGVLMAARAICPDCEITVRSRYSFQAQTAERLKADHILDGKDDYPSVAKLTGGKYFSAPLNRGIVVGGFDLIYDCVGTPHTLNDSLRWVKAGGKVVIVGNHISPMQNIDLVPVWYHQVDLVGVVANGTERVNGQSRHSFDLVYDFIKSGAYQTDGLITHRYPFRDYKEAIRLAAGHKGGSKAIKVILEE